MDQEYFVAIAGTDGKYEISNTGRVRSLYFQGMERENPLYLKPGLSSGYYTVAILINGVITTKSIHRLLARHFLPNPNFYNEVNHRDGDRTNNSLDNLEWCNRQQNVRHAVDVLDKMNGSKNFFALFTENQVNEILRRRLVLNVSSKYIADEFNTNQTTIINICAGRRYKKEFKRFMRDVIGLSEENK